jgi:pimeloyl-ACP methyl ester carboxylesterase
VAELVDVPGATLWTVSQGAGVPGAEDTDPARTRTVADVVGRYVEIADAGHSPWLERPQPLRAALRAFLAEPG